MRFRLGCLLAFTSCALLAADKGGSTYMALGDSIAFGFEPSLLGSYTKRTAPDYAPHSIGCADVSGWQYQISAGSTPDVDSDQLVSRIPLWYP